MRQLFGVCAILATSLFAAGQTGGQAAVVGGYASTWVTSPGAFAVPNPPLVSTPSVSLDAAPSSPIGASNATAGNVAGATTATLSVVPQPSRGPFATTVWYGPATGNEASVEMEESARPVRHGNSFDLGIASFQGNVSVAKLMAEQHAARRKASRVYTNEDTAQAAQQANQSVGVVKHGGKTERLN